MRASKHIIATSNEAAERNDHILHALRKNSYENAIDLHTAYKELITAIADNWLFNQLAFHCELHRAPMPLVELNAAAIDIYNKLIRPPVWYWRSNLHKRLTRNATISEYKSITDYLHMKAHTYGGFIHCSTHAAPPFTPTPATTETP